MSLYTPELVIHDDHHRAQQDAAAEYTRTRMTALGYPPEDITTVLTALGLT